ncbi:MAG: hypothetical protein HDS65_08500 [Bacteroidales bacterium]|nr:hypothetical protein [Bacteroidales bacterium]
MALDREEVGGVIGGLLALGGVLVWGLRREIRQEKKRLKEVEARERLIASLGGEYKIRKIELISANYRGKRNVYGSGISVRGCGDDWAEAEFDLKLDAAKKGCNIVLDVLKEGSRAGGFVFSGKAYNKR